MKCMVKYTPIKVMQLSNFCWPMTPLIIGLAYPMTTYMYAPLVAGNLPKTTMVARRWPTKYYGKNA